MNIKKLLKRYSILESGITALSDRRRFLIEQFNLISAIVYAIIGSIRPVMANSRIGIRAKSQNFIEIITLIKNVKSEIEARG